MANKSEARGGRPENEAEELSGLNVETASGKDSAQRLRRKMEASIEDKARKRRKREVPASSAWKP